MPSRPSPLGIACHAFPLSVAIGTFYHEATQNTNGLSSSLQVAGKETMSAGRVTVAVDRDLDFISGAGGNLGSVPVQLAAVQGVRKQQLPVVARSRQEVDVPDGPGGERVP